MAGNKKVPLVAQGFIIGTASLDEAGFINAEIDLVADSPWDYSAVKAITFINDGDETDVEFHPAFNRV